jgi:hypothetical protein
MNTNGFNLLAALAIIAAAAVALVGNTTADDVLATALVGLAGTIAGRGKN